MNNEPVSNERAHATSDSLLQPTTASVARPGSYLVQLDGIRCLAVLLVLIDHWLAERNQLPLGPLGVTLFFVLSGFLIARILLNSKARIEERGETLWSHLRRFYIRRTLRIFPIYYLSLIVLFVAGVPVVREFFWWYITYMTNILIAWRQQWLGPTDHLWSLAAEEQFYLFFPITLFLVPKRHLPTLFVAMIVGSIALRYYFHQRGASWIVNYVLTPTSLDAFGLGALLAYLATSQTSFFMRFFRNNLWVPLCVLAWIGTVYLEKQPGLGVHNVFNDVWLGLVASLLGFFLIGKAVIGYTGPLKWLLQNRVSVYLGQISYGLYLYHNFVYNFYHTPATNLAVRIWNRAVRELPPLNDFVALKLAYYFMLTVVVASLSWFLIEKPINALKDKFTY